MVVGRIHVQAAVRRSQFRHWTHVSTAVKDFSCKRLRSLKVPEETFALGETATVLESVEISGGAADQSVAKAGAREKLLGGSAGVGVGIGRVLEGGEVVAGCNKTGTGFWTMPEAVDHSGQAVIGRQ